MSRSESIAKEISDLVVIRRLRTEDIEAVAEVARALHPKWFTEDAVKEIESTLQAQNAYIALADEKTIGFATYLAYYAGKRAELNWIGVLPGLHRQGIGRMLVGAIERVLAEQGIKTLDVYTVAASVEYEPYALTRCFYHALGFCDIRIEIRGFPSGDDKLLLRKLLQT